MSHMLMYPVSAVMKALHLVLADLLGLPPSAAWTASVVLLVALIRLALLPLARRGHRNARVMVNLRPDMRRLSDYWSRHADPDAAKYHSWARKELQRRHGVSMKPGCIMPLVQIPVFIGLYRLVRSMAHAGGEPRPIALMSADEVAEFQRAHLLGAPLAAFARAPEALLEAFDSSRAESMRVIVPLILLAFVFTTGNITAAVVRSSRSLDHGNRTARGLHRMLVVYAAVGGLFPLVFGFLTPVPVAGMLYWVSNNLWTACQYTAFHLIIDRRIPFTEEYLAFSEEARKAVKAERALPRRERRAKRREDKERRLEERRKVARVRAMVRSMRPRAQAELPDPMAAGVTAGRRPADPGRDPGPSAGA